jgi:2-C-methyl-D-erythritol 4-phosphate cytidylyltransferase
VTQCAVVIVGGGSGTRMGPGIPKQFRELLGTPLYLWSVGFFESSDCVGEIVVVAPASELRNAELGCKAAGAKKVTAIVEGGARRQDSVAAGFAAVSPKFEVVLIHDAARPFPPANTEQLLQQALQAGAAIFAVPVSETLKRIDYPRIVETVPREHVWAAQTPQAFRRDVLKPAIDFVSRSEIEVTDDAAAVEALGRRVDVVPGSHTNIKITNPEDWTVAETLALVLRRRAGRLEADA